MLQYKIVLKGLKPGEDVYCTETFIITGNTEQEIDDHVSDLIYEIRNLKSYYKMRYHSKDKVQEPDEKCTSGVEQVQSNMANPRRNKQHYQSYL